MTMPRRFAAPAPDRELPPRTDRLEAEIHNLATMWASWSRTRRRFGAPAPVGSQIRKLVFVSGGNDRDGRLDPQLAAFHLAITEWPHDYAPRRMFEMHFLRERGVRIKELCADLKIGRATWYRTVNQFARHCYARHHELRRA